MTRAYQECVLIVLLLAACATLSSCVTTQPAEEVQPAEDKPPVLTPDEQDKKAMEAYENILTLAEGQRRSQVLPQLERAHLDVIEMYPNSYFAQESYLTLIRSNLIDYYPPRWEKVEALYRQYVERYPKPRLNDTITFYIARAYYRHGKWPELAAFTIPFMKRYVETGTLPAPAHLFYYSEAMYYTADYSEAEKGYRLILTEYADTREAQIAKDRIDTIKRKKTEPQGER
jgi:tetratricopeptide (TPR) repeat protein